MNKKKSFYGIIAVMLVAFTAFAFAACSKDDEKDKIEGYSIVGTWLCQAQQYVVSFQADGTGFDTSYANFDKNEIPASSYFNWTQNDGQLTLTYSDRTVNVEYLWQDGGVLFLRNLNGVPEMKFDVKITINK